jgi:hypothetical protein
MSLTVVSHQHDRTGELLVSGIQQGGVVGLGEAAPFAFSSTMDFESVQQPPAGDMGGCR